MKAEKGVGDPMPGGRGRPRWSIVYPRPATPLEVVIVSRTWLGVNTHWVKPHNGGKGRTTLCMRPGPCICDTEAIPEKWHGYLGVLLWHSATPAVLTSTKRSITSILDVAGDRTTLSGLGLIVKRLTDHPSSVATAHPNPKDWRRPLPDPFDLVPTLETVYGRGELEQWLERNGRKDGVV